MIQVEIHAIFEKRNGGDAEAVRVDGMTGRQFSYVCWHEREFQGRRLAAIVGKELSQEG
jgi:hypothetical protein